MSQHSATSGVAAGLVLVLATACGGSAGSPGSAEPQTAAETGAVTAVSDEQGSGSNEPSIAEYLRGQVPGLQVVSAPDGGVSVKIRGGGAREPLLVLDGVPVQAEAMSQVLSRLNPNDISRVRVLKDVASTAMYGARGAYGVLLITTRGND